MATEWIPIRKDLADDPHTIGLSIALDCSPDEVVGILVRFWGWADSMTADGNVRILSASQADILTTNSGSSAEDSRTENGQMSAIFPQIDRIARRQGFASAMVEVGWLQICNGCAVVPDFAEYLGKSSKRRALDRKRKSSVRKTSAKVPQNVRTASGQNADYRTEQNRTEDIREEEPPLPPSLTGGGSPF